MSDFLRSLGIIEVKETGKEGPCFHVVESQWGRWQLVLSAIKDVSRVTKQRFTWRGVFRSDIQGSLL